MMQYRTMKKTGDEVSALGFGAMRLSSNGRRIDEERAKSQILYSIDNGVNYVDTAFSYHHGASEPFLGRALSGGYRRKVRLATKLPHWLVKTREDMDRYLGLQLSRLSTDHIEYYLIHSLDGPSWDNLTRLGVADFLDRARQDGRIGARGFSFHGDKDSFKRIVDAYDWDFCQIQYNYLDVDCQAGKSGLEYAGSKGLGVIIMEPLRGGYLTSRVPPDVEALWSEAGVRRSPAEWALRWVWNHPEVTIVLSGMNDEKHIDENLRIADEALPESLTLKEMDLVRRAADTYRRIMKVGCTGCQYCMPCPAGVDIAGCFELYNNSFLPGGDKVAIFFYIARMMGAMSGTAANASLCVNCGKCLEKCPQNLAIPDLLSDVTGKFEKWWLKPAEYVLRTVVGFQRWAALRRAGRGS
jgi:predicted aldo/keto reductase-like oxidoreductase